MLFLISHHFLPMTNKILNKFSRSKTLTIKLADKLILCSGLGDFKVSKGSLIEIGDSLGISKKKNPKKVL